MSGPRHREHIPIETTVMKLEELAVYLKVHPTTLYRMLKRGQLPAFRVASEWRFDREQIDAWRHKQETGYARHAR